MSGNITTLPHTETIPSLPGAWHERRNGFLATLVIGLALILGWFFKDYVLDQWYLFRPGQNLPSMIYPKHWVRLQVDDLKFQAINPHSSAAFESRVELRLESAVPGESLSLLAANRSFQLGQSLVGYRSIDSEVVEGPSGQPAVINTYAYVTKANPDAPREYGLPVVVRAQDLLYLNGKDDSPSLVVVTAAAEADQWDREAPTFQRVFDHILTE